MQRMGVDLHKRESQLAINAADGTITDSEWVGRHLESLGHEVIGAVRVSGVVPRGAGRAHRTSPPHVGASGRRGRLRGRVGRRRVRIPRDRRVDHSRHLAGRDPMMHGLRTDP